jgi:hypothetical protein
MARGSSSASTIDDQRSQVSRARSYASTSATSVSISGDIASQLHGGYSHPLARTWQAERQLTKVGIDAGIDKEYMLIVSIVNVDSPTFHHRQ